MTGGKASDIPGELDARARLRIGVAGLGVALAVATLVAAVGPGLRQPLFDLYQSITPAPAVSRRVHVVVIDADSLRNVGGWPWSRFYLARLVEQISNRGAAAIGVDILLPEPDRQDPAQFAGIYPELPPAVAADVRRLPSMDAVFARVIGRSAVVLARAGVRPGSFDALDRADAPLPPEAAFSGQAPRNMLAFPTVVANLPLLDGAPLGHGLINGDPDADGVVRRVPLVARAAGALTPGFALELVRVAERKPRIDLEGSDGRLEAVRLAGRRIPSTADGQLLLRFADWRVTQTTSAANVLRKGAPADLFKGQIVLIGLTSAGAADLVSTPRAKSVNGVYVQAQAVDAVLRGSGLQRPAWTAVAEWGLGLGLVLAAWFGIPRVPMTLAAGIAAGAGVAAVGGSWLAFANNLLVDPIPMLAPGAATCAVMIVLLYTEGRRTQARLRAVLEAERRRAEEHQQLLINELNHRVKNTLATVQSIAVQTLRPDRGAVEAREAFTSRLIALSTAHNVLTAERWESADLADIAQMAVAPFNEPPDAHVQVEGPGLRLKPPHALAIAMALHELGTNAVKFGALSIPGGVVRLAWEEGAGREVRMVWEESGGPRVEAPTRRGFGTRLIQEGLARELRGQVHVEHRPAGLRCEIVFRRDLED